VPGGNLNSFAAQVGMPALSEIIHSIILFYLQRYKTSSHLKLIKKEIYDSMILHKKLIE